MKKSDLIEYSIFLLSFLTILLYFFANIVQYAYTAHIPSSITFFRYGSGVGTFIDSYLNLYLPGDITYSGWITTGINITLIMYDFIPVILLPILLLYGSITKNNNIYHIS